MLFIIFTIFILCFSLTAISASDNNTNVVNIEDNSLSCQDSLNQSYQSESDNDNILTDEDSQTPNDNEDDNEIGEDTGNSQLDQSDNNEEIATLDEESYIGTGGKASKSTVISGVNRTVNFDSGAYYKVKLTDKANNPLSGKLIRFKVNGKLFNSTTDKNGIAKLLINFPVNIYTITYYFAGSGEYDCASGTSTIKVTKAKTGILTSNTKIIYKSGKKLTILLKSANGKALANRQIYIKIRNKLYIKTTDKKGYVYLTVSGFNLGKYPTVLSFKGGKNYAPSAKVINFYVYKIKTNLIAKSESFRYGLGQYYSVKLKDQYGSALASKTIRMIINGKTFTAKTSENGIAKFKISQGAGKYIGLIRFYSTNTYYDSSKLVALTVLKGKTYIKSSDVTVNYPSKPVIKLKFYNANGSPLKNHEISIKINKKTYKKSTNGTGEVSFSLSIIPGKYKTTLSFAGTKNLLSISKTITVNVNKISTKIKGKNANILEYNDDIYEVTLTDKNNKVLSGKTVYFYVNNLVLSAKTNAKGVAQVKVNTEPGKYVISYKFKGDAYYDAKIGSSNLTVKADPRMKANTTASPLYLLKGKTGYFYITLVNAKNNVGLPGKKITINFRNKTYTRTTDNNGKVKLFINISKTGKYTVNYNFRDSGDSEVAYKDISGSSFVKIIELKSGMTLTWSEVKGLGLPTITVSGKPSCLDCARNMEKGKISYKNYTTTFVNWCPFCNQVGKLTWNPKHVYEGEITCGSGSSKNNYGGGCDADFCGVCGYDKTVNLRAKLIKVVSG